MFSATESAEVWDRWQRGEGLRLIGRVLDRSSGAIAVRDEKVRYATVLAARNAIHRVVKG